MPAHCGWTNDTGGRHSHADGMNLGLFAKGVDLMPDFGYPPVQYGGWDSPRAQWYRMSAAHNTVVVDGATWRPTATGPNAPRAAPSTYAFLRSSGSGAPPWSANPLSR